MQERQRLWSVVRVWTSFRVQANFHEPLVALVGSNSIFCNGCKHWVHKKCNGLKRLTEDSNYRCTWWQRTAHPLDGRPQREVQVGPHNLQVVGSFCYLGAMLSAVGGCELSTTTHVKTAWKKFKELLAVLSSYHLSFKAHGHVYSSCVWSAMLHACGRGHGQRQTSNVFSRMTGQWSDRSAMSSHTKLSPSGSVSYLRSLALRIWTSFSRREGSAPLVWTCETFLWCSQDSLWHTGWWKEWALEAQDNLEAADRGIAESGSSLLSALMIDTPGDLVWDMPCVQQASYLEGGPTDVDVAPVPAH